MLHTLDLRRFRGFEAYRLTGLARVNLLVGKNNCGKTSILEVIELLVSEGNPGILSNPCSDVAAWLLAGGVGI